MKKLIGLLYQKHAIDVNKSKGVATERNVYRNYTPKQPQREAISSFRVYHRGIVAMYTSHQNHSGVCHLL
jgi:hypothetical protein